MSAPAKIEPHPIKGGHKTPQFLWRYKGMALLLLFSLAGVFSYPFRLSQGFYAIYVIAAFFILAVFDLNFSFLVLLFLTQFFIGDFYRPYMFLIDILGLFFAIVWFIKTNIDRKKIEFPLWWIIIPYMLVMSLAIPLNLKEVVLDVKIWGGANFLKQIASAGTLSHAFWFRELGWELISFFLFLSVFNMLISRTGDERKIWYTLALTLIISAAAGLMLLYDWIPYEGQFLSINFADAKDNPGMLTSYGWSVTFFAEYFAAMFPFVLYLLFVQKGRLKKTVVFFFAVVTVFAVMKTYRRAAFVVLFLEIFFSGMFFVVIRLGGVKKNFFCGKEKIGRYFLWVIISILIFGTVVLFIGKQQNNMLSRVVTEFSLERLRKDPRLPTHELCLHMAKHEPVLGLGSGGYSQQFDRRDGKVFLRRYEKHVGYDRWLNDYQGSPHSTYLKVLAERGILGLIAFLWLAGGFLWIGLRVLRAEPLGEKKWFPAALSTSLLGMLVYAFFMDIFWVPGVRILFWVVLGMIAAIAYPMVPRIPFTKKKAIAFGIIFFVLLGYRLWRVKAEPVSDHYEAGFYRWKIPRKGKDRRPYRFTSPRALKVFTVKGDEIKFRVCSNKPDISKNPQILSIYFNGNPVKRVELKGKDWREVIISTGNWKGKRIFMDFRVDGTWVPYKYGMGKSRRPLGIIISKIRQG